MRTNTRTQQVEKSEEPRREYHGRTSKVGELWDASVPERTAPAWIYHAVNLLFTHGADPRLRRHRSGRQTGIPKVGRQQAKRRKAEAAEGSQEQRKAAEAAKGSQNQRQRKAANAAKGSKEQQKAARAAKGGKYQGPRKAASTTKGGKEQRKAAKAAENGQRQRRKGFRIPKCTLG